MPLKRLLSGFNAYDDHPGDVTNEDWEPVPVTATALPEDTFDWLQGDPMPLLPIDSSVTLDEEQPVPEHPQCFSVEELAIIEQQKAESVEEELEAEPEPLFKMPTGPQPQFEAEAALARELVEQKLEPEPPPQPPQPRKRLLSERGRWVEVVKNVGEHLSELELKIIRKQLASS